MGPIEIGKAIDTYGIAVVTAIILGLLVWLVRVLVKNTLSQQKEERTYFRKVLTNDLQEIHKDNTKNVELNNQSITNQRKIISLIGLIDRRNNGRTKENG